MSIPDEAALAAIIWSANHRDEKSLSATGANVIARAVIAELSGIDGAEQFRSVIESGLRRLGYVDFSKGYAQDVAPVVAEDPRANVVTSVATQATLVEGVWNPQYPVIDVDVPCHWVPSSTPGHGHLYIDHPVAWGDFLDVLNALVSAGLVEPGYQAACEREGFASVRLPWVGKSDR